MARTLCDWKKHEIHDDIEDLAKIVRDPRYVCRKCARSAHSDKHLCKPMALPTLHHDKNGEGHQDHRH